MSREPDLLESIKSCLDDDGKVLVTVGDFGAKPNARSQLTQLVIIHCVYIRRHDIMHYKTNILGNSPDEISNILESVKKLVSPFYFIKEMSDSDSVEFQKLFN